MPLRTEQHIQQYRAKGVTVPESILPVSLNADLRQGAETGEPQAREPDRPRYLVVRARKRVPDGGDGDPREST